MVTVPAEVLAPGEVCVLRYRYPDGGVQAALPMRVVEDSPGRTVAWLAPATRVLYQATAEGGDPRDVPLERRFTSRDTTAPRSWQGPGVLHVMESGLPYQVLLFRNEDGSFRHWYVNLETPRVRTCAFFDTVDHHLDLIVHPDGSHVWKDEDEAAAAVAAGRLDPADLASARATGEALTVRIDGWTADLAPWLDWRPPEHWTVPELPPDAAHPERALQQEESPTAGRIGPDLPADDEYSC